MPSFLGVPDVVWSGVIGSSIAFFGVWLSNKSNTDRLTHQLRHDAHEKSIQRRSDIRKAAYLEFAEEFAKANAYIGGLVNRISFENMDTSEGLTAFQAAAAKVQLLTEASTADAFATLMTEHVKLFVEATERIIPIQVTKASIKGKDRLYEECQTEIKRILSEMSAFNETASTDRLRFDALKRALEERMRHSDAIAAERSALWDTANGLTADYTRHVMSRIPDVMRASAPVLAAMRRELEIDGYNVNFEKMMLDRFMRMHEEAKRVTDGFIERALSKQQLSNGESPSAARTS
ncbi:hypothetical protein H3V53_38205 [Paraburkholderia bengalensis]|uniref:Uncharacterized protein n=1 Tax=Paraburkholderia bengalensis TaxID=2747562 RepID=A0ABU8J4R3_9BURK